jgi:leader peptidase (prepilin peptidase) / N-methyltransferase
VPLAAAAAAVAAVAGLLLGGPLHSLARRLARGRPAFPGWAGWDGARGRAATRAVTAGLLAATVLVLRGDAAQLVLGLLLVAVLVPLTLVDVAVRLLPDRLTGAAAIAAILAGTLLDPGGEAGRLVAGLAAGGAFLLAAIARPGDMGMGDVKLAAVLGLFLGADVAVAVFVALMAGVVAGLALMARKGVRAGRATAIAFGPFLALGAVVAMLAGDGLLDAYVKAL